MDIFNLPGNPVVAFRCSTHEDRELSFCEQCAKEFCLSCDPKYHLTCSRHTVTNISTATSHLAIVMASKLYQYDTDLECYQKVLLREMNRLDIYAGQCRLNIESAFSDLNNNVDGRKVEILSNLADIREHKRKVLRDQLDAIISQRHSVSDILNDRSGIEINDLASRVSDVNEALRTIPSLVEPLDNHFIRYDCSHAPMLRSVNAVGCVKTSKTFPPFCTADLAASVSTFLGNKIRVTCRDINNRNIIVGGDSVRIQITSTDDENIDIEDPEICDHCDGSYETCYALYDVGNYSISVTVFERHILGSPFKIVASSHIDALSIIGSKGRSRQDFLQPTSVVFDSNAQIFYILDCGNLCVKAFAANGLDPLYSFSVSKGSTGLCLKNSGSLFVITWSLGCLHEYRNGALVSTYYHKVLTHMDNVTICFHRDLMFVGSIFARVTIFRCLESSELTFLKSFTLPWRQLSVGTRRKRISKQRIVTCILPLENQNAMLLLCRELWILYLDSTWTMKKVNLDFLSSSGIIWSAVEIPRANSSSINAESFILACTDQHKTCLYIVDKEFQLVFVIDSFANPLGMPLGLAAIDDGKLVVSDVLKSRVSLFRFM